MESNAARTGALADTRRRAAPWVELLARAGYAAKGIVYILVGGLAASAALRGGGTEGSEDALAQLSGAPFGRVLLGIIALGLAGFVVWRLVGATLNPENDGAGRRAFYVVSALVYGGLAMEAGRLSLEAGGGGEGDHWTRTLMAQPFGPWLVVLAGAAVALFGLQQIWRGFTADIDDRLALSALSSRARAWAIRTGRLGLGARGVVLAIIGAFMVGAGLSADPASARGVGGALSAVRGQPYGRWLLAAVALGLVAYGVYGLVRARWRRIRAV